MRPRAWSGLAACVLALAARPGPARACSLVGLTPATIDKSLQAVDHTPPSLPAIPPPVITRGHGPANQGCGGGSTAASCDDIGELAFTVMGTDDMTPAAHLGYSFSLVDGNLPEGFSLPLAPVEPQSATSIVLSWVDGALNGQDSIAFTLRIVALDGAGNESVPRLVDIRNGSSGACRVAPRGRPPGAVVLVAAAAAVLAARRRRRTA
jgi:hypothetical protein